LASGLYAQAGSELGTPFATGCQSNGSELLAIADRHPRPWLHKGRDALGEDFPLTKRIAAGELAGGQEKLDPAPCAGNISQNPAIVTMDR